MIISAQDILSNKDWLHNCLLKSLTVEVIDDAKNNHDMSYDVKLVVNGFELEPKTLDHLIQNVVSYIEGEAMEIVNNRMSDALAKVRKLEEIIESASDKIRDEFDIKIQD